ncbi:SLC13 family permease [Sphingomonas donggukensis]|uniref:SLC13 family permease n=2 Tax=Sphingomonas donggukensis TaxID=2949093 RepID=A0ABY4TZJ5_9SPHN|nr:SLC13 family permease [Sphingomonas donggukensis]URW77071.1 SLC13 family permease [Sphingomonas donggukensis]
MLLTAAMFYGFVSGRARVEIISLLTISAIALGLYWFPLPGQAPTDGLKLAFEGFGHYALITICALMVLGRGLVTTGALEPAARLLTRVWQFNRQIGLLVTLLLAFGMSMMVNDTPVLVLMLPVMAAIAANGGLPASRTLIPVNSAVLIGGMSTTIGTSTNLLVVSIAGDLGLPPMSVFHFTPIVLLAALVALPFIWLVMPRLLPDNSVEAGHEPRRFTAMLRLGENSFARNLPRDQMAARLPADVEILGDAAMGDQMLVRASHDALEETMRILGATAAPAWLMDRLHSGYSRTGEDLTVAELAVTKDSGLVGKGVASANVAELYNVAILGVHRAHRPWIAQPVVETAVESPFDEGDILLVAGSLGSIERMSLAENMFVLDGAKELPRTAKASLALAIMAAAVLPASIGLVPIAIGRIVLESGAASWLSELIALGLQFLPPAGVLAAVMLFVTILTNFASNTTAAAVGTPIAFSLGQQLGIPVEPLVLAVLFGCNLCYATPVDYQTNMLIMSAGDYRFKDYTRTGLPLVAIMVVTLSGLLVLRYGLY